MSPPGLTGSRVLQGRAPHRALRRAPGVKVCTRALAASLAACTSRLLDTWHWGALLPVSGLHDLPPVTALPKSGLPHPPGGCWGTRGLVLPASELAWQWPGSPGPDAHHPHGPGALVTECALPGCLGAADPPAVRRSARPQAGLLVRELASVLALLRGDPDAATVSVRAYGDTCTRAQASLPGGWARASHRDVRAPGAHLGCTLAAGRALHCFPGLCSESHYGRQSQRNLWKLPNHPPWPRVIPYPLSGCRSRDDPQRQDTGLVVSPRPHSVHHVAPSKTRHQVETSREAPRRGPGASCGAGGTCGRSW